MASAAIRTLAKVKSSAMTARQPSVPNLICGWGMIGFLFSLGTMVKEVSADEWSRWRARGFPPFSQRTRKGWGTQLLWVVKIEEAWLTECCGLPGLKIEIWDTQISWFPRFRFGAGFRSVRCGRRVPAPSRSCLHPGNDRDGRSAAHPRCPRRPGSLQIGRAHV